MEEYSTIEQHELASRMHKLISEYHNLKAYTVKYNLEGKFHVAEALEVDIDELIIQISSLKTIINNLNERYKNLLTVEN